MAFGIQEEEEDACTYSVVDDDANEVVEDMSNSSCDLVAAVEYWARAPDDANEVVVWLQDFHSGDESCQ